jgi:hypothetical protein
MTPPPIIKYPRTPHLAGSRIQPGDEDLDAVAVELLHGLPIVVEEKLDGSNCGLSFDEDGRLLLQSRGHILTGGPRERQFDLFKRWANHHVFAFNRILGTRYVMYGEWLYARHTIYYDRLPHYFLEFDVLDKERDEFLSTDRRQALLAGSGVVSVPLLGIGSVSGLAQYIGRSHCSSSNIMEGLYVKHEESGRVHARYKFVREGFLQAVEESDEHWMDRPIEANRLRDGVDLFA